MTTEDFIKLHNELGEKLSRDLTKQTRETIDITVNGKINRLDQKIDLYIAQDTQWKEDDRKWKETAQPSVDLGLNAISFWKVVKWILFAGAALGGFLAALEVIKRVIL